MHQAETKKKNGYAGLRRIILSSMILVPLVPFISALAIGYYYFRFSLYGSTLASLERIVDDHQQMIEAFLDERKADLNFVLNMYTLEMLSKPDLLEAVFIQLQKKSNAFTDLGIFNDAGLHVAYCGPYKLTGKTYSDAEWFKEVTKTGYYVSDVFLGYRRVPHFIIAAARQDGDARWVVRATIDTYIFNELVEKVRIGKSGEAYILNKVGCFQTRRRSGGNLMEKDPEHESGIIRHEGIRTFLKEDVRGDKYLYATTWLKNKNWALVVRLEKADAFKHLRSASSLIILISVLGGFAITFLAVYLTDRIVRRMERIDNEKGTLRQQLIGASRLAELGEMATGFAHEINNPLQIMKSERALVDGILEDMEEKYNLKGVEDLSALKDAISQIDTQIDRCARITQSVLKFGRQGEPRLQSVDLKKFIPEVVGMITKKAEVQGIRLLQDIDGRTPLIHGDPAQLQQVLLNLCNNAMDAVTQRHGLEGGEILIHTRPLDDGQVELSVKDNGIGINAENLNKIFTPFFTTKPVGKGTGLGLSVCYGIIEHMGGNMTVSSQPGGGAGFTIVFPASQCSSF